MGVVYGMYVGEEKYILGVGNKTRKKENLEGLVVDGRMWIGFLLFLLVAVTW